MTARSHRPFSQWVLDQEILHLASLRHFLAQAGVPPRCIRECRVDSMLLQAGTRKHRDVRDKIANLTWKDQAESQQCAFQLPWPSSECEEPVFRAEELQHDDKTILDFEPPLPVTEGVEPAATPWWTDLDEDAARNAALQHEGLMVRGIGGTGKTTFVRTLVAALRENGEKVAVISRCHVSAKLFEGGMTADRFLLSSFKKFRGTLVIEEAS